MPLACVLVSFTVQAPSNFDGKAKRQALLAVIESIKGPFTIPDDQFRGCSKFGAYTAVAAL